MREGEGVARLQHARGHQGVQRVERRLGEPGGVTHPHAVPGHRDGLGERRRLRRDAQEHGAAHLLRTGHPRRRELVGRAVELVQQRA